MRSSFLYDTTLTSIRNSKPQAGVDMIRAARILDERYALCDTQGHLGPDIEGSCGSCHRAYTYDTIAELPLTEAERESGMTIDYQLLEANPGRYIELQKARDRLRGLEIIESQLEAGLL